MKKTIKKLWVKALRSGEYKQGHERLRTQEDAYCCLGVLCNLYAQKTNTPWVKYPKSGWFIVDTRAFPNDSILKWAGIKFGELDATKMKHHKRKTTSLVEMNDDKNCDFNYIADIIEAQL